MEQHNNKPITNKPIPLTDSDLLAVIRQTIQNFKDRVEKNSLSVSTSDLIRLLEIEAEISQRNETQEIIVKWVDPNDFEQEQEALLEPQPAAL
jgi:hypothetical protein